MTWLILKTPKVSKFYMLLQWFQTTFNIWYYQSRKCFSQNSVVNMRYVAMATVAPLQHQLPLKRGTSFWKPTRKWNMWICAIWATTWQNQQNERAPNKDTDQPGHPPSLIRVFAVRMKKPLVLSYPLSAQQRLWSDWVDARLIWVFAGRTLTWMVLSCRGSFVKSLR